MIVPSLRTGGAEKQAVDLASSVSKDDFRIDFLTFEKEMDLLAELNRTGVTFHHVERKSKFDTSFIGEIADIIEEREIDLIHCTLQIAYLFGLLGRLRSKRKPPLVCALHTTVNRGIKDAIFDWLLYAPLMTFCRGIITVSQNQHEYWARKYPWLGPKMVTVHNGVDTARYISSNSSESLGLRRSLGLAEDEFVILMIAAMRPEKGHEYALAAAQKLVRHGQKIRLILVGDGERRASLESFSRKLGLDRTVLWMGHQGDTRPFLSSCDVLLVSSYAVETLPLSVLEALSTGKPVVATRIGGIPEIIRDGVNGLLVSPRDASALEYALKKLILDGNLRKRLSQRARDTVLEKFSSAEMAKNTQVALRQWLDSPREPS